MIAKISPSDRTMSVMTGDDGNDRHSIMEEWKTFMHEFVIADGYGVKSRRKATYDFRRRQRVTISFGRMVIRGIAPLKDLYGSYQMRCGAWLLVVQ